ncbi:MAG: hypothetical protein MUF18_14900 [Fimbriiglobus sp.]|jgi:hypothetical protein|nr:hypothetical protein [Fimbriiglobus sp.]
MSVRLIAAAIAAVAFVGTASAQYPGYGYTFTNPYTGYTTGFGTAYNPYTGNIGSYTVGYNPWSGFGTRNFAYQNVYGLGFGRGVSNFNNYTGAYYGNRLGFNPFYGAYNYNRFRFGRW